jgi:UDP-N-acetylmuramoyl-tripeptide--D-alanyl-D-alanine ligase
LSTVAAAPHPPLDLQLTDIAQSMAASMHMGRSMPALHIDTLCTDSRALVPGCLFLALRGEHFDGHDFVKQALACGAQAVVVDKRAAAALKDVQAPILVVDDTLKALGDWARWMRRRQHGAVAAITGSNGKTTTKEMLAAVLKQRGPVHKTAGNLNNLIGLPLTVLRRPKDVWASVLEMGMSVPGEIARLTQIAQPDVGLITCVAAAHLEGLGSIEAVAKAKTELFANLPEHSVAVLNADDAVLVAHSLPHLSRHKVVRFGTAPSHDVQLCDVKPDALGLSFALRFEGGAKWPVQLPVPGRHNALNAAGAAAAARALGLAPQQIVAGLADVVLPGGRLRVLAGGPMSTHLIDDSYNANPGSMQAALMTLVDLAASSRKLAAFGDMLELGPQTAQMHRALGLAAATSGVGIVFALGQQAEHIARGAREGGARAYAFADFESLRHGVLEALQPQDWLLVKGSRGMRMERLVDSVLKGGA